MTIRAYSSILKNSSDIEARLRRAAVFIGLLAVLPSAHALLTNGDFSSGLTGWKTEGTVMADGGVATLTEGASAPVLYQPVEGSDYVYELRFDLDLNGLSSDAGSGQLDTVQVLVYVGTDAGSLTPDGAADEALLIEADASGLLSVAENAQVVPNVALGAGWYSAVVEVTSDFEAIAPAATILDGNSIADSSIGIDRVVLMALDRGRFANISNRGGVGTGASIMIPGFVIEGPTNKSLLIRGVGPTLGEFGVPGTISDPQLKLYFKPPTQPGQPPAVDELKAENDNWEEASDVDALKAAMESVGAFDLTEGSLDAALLAEDLVPGAYTVQVSGLGGVTGVALAEVYDQGASADGPTELVNISNRGFIGTGSSVQIPGFVIAGTRGRVVLARAVGPTLGGFGVPGTIEDPTLELIDQADQTTPLFTNDNWEDAANKTEVEATAARVGAFSLGAGSKDAAILASLSPGSYTAVARGVDGSTGVALVEVYVVTDNQRPTAADNSLYVTTSVEIVLPMDEILGNDTDPENDILSVGSFTQPDRGTVAMSDDGELVYTSSVNYFGEAVFSYRASDGEYESVPATIVLQVTPANAVIWEGGSSGNFSDPANWVGGEAPGENDPVWIAPAGDTAITIDADTTVGSIRAGGTGAKVTLKMTAGKTLTASGGLQIQPGSTLELRSGILDTQLDAVISGQLIWGGGTMTGEGTTIIAEGASALLNTSAVYLRGGRDFLNSGTLTQSGRAALISDTADATSTITNALGAEWTTTMSDGHTIAYPYQATATVEFTNAGTLTKNGATTLLGNTRGTFNLTNTGTLEVASGTLRLVSNGAVDLSGSITQSDSTTLQLFGATTTLNGTLESGVGSVLRVDAGGTLTIPSGKVLSDVEKLIISGSTLILHESHTLADVELASGTLDIRSALSVATLKLNGTLLAPADVTITDTLTWTGGIMTGEGTTIIAEGASALLNTSAVYLRGGRDFLNNGTLTQSGRAALISDTADATSTITNALGAEWTTTMSDGHTIAYPYQATATVEFTNAGTLTKNGATTLLGNTRGTFNLTNTGTLEVAAGTLRLVSNGAVDLSGSITQSDGTTLQLFGITTALNGTLEPGVGSVLRVDAGGTLTIPSGKVLSDVEKLIISGSTLILHESHTLADVELASGTLDIRSALSVATLKLNGTLLAPADVTITDTLTWTGGIMTGEGTTIIAEGASALLNTSAVYLRGGRDFLNNGTLTQSGRAALISDTADATSTITNALGAEWTTTMSDGHTIAYPYHATATVEFTNAGTLTKNGATTLLGNTRGTFNLTNTGTLEVAAGTLRLVSNGAVDLSGSITQSDGTTLQLFGITTALNGTLEPGVGSVLRVDAGGTLTIPSGKVLSDVEKLIISGSTLILHESHTLADVELASGTLDIRSALSVATLKLNGTLLAPADVTITDTLTWTGGIMTGEGTTIIAEGASALLNTSAVYLRGGRDFLNNGTLTQSGRAALISDTADATSTITNALGAEWTTTMSDGHTIAYPYQATATVEFTNAGTLTKNGATTLLGNTRGTFNLTNTGTLEVASGELRVAGTSLVLDASGTVRLVTNGTTKPLVRQGALSIDGTLEVILADGYAPANGTTIRLINYTSKTGAFSTITPPQGRTVAEAYASDGLDVTIN